MYYHGPGIHPQPLLEGRRRPTSPRRPRTVLAENSQSGAAVQYIADYFYYGPWPTQTGHRSLVHRPQAKAPRRRRAGEAGRFPPPRETIRRIDRPVAAARQAPAGQPRLPRPAHARLFPHRPQSRVARSLLKETDAFFHDKDRWGERSAQPAGPQHAAKRAVRPIGRLLQGADPDCHERTQPNRGIGDGTLASYYVGLADAYAGLKKTPEAVEAAGAAIVAWGSRNNNREEALEDAQAVLLDSPRPGCLRRDFDKQKQDSAIIRKALGQAYSDKKEHAKAIKQLELAATLQPNDAEIYKLLIESYDASGDKEGAVRQLLQAVQLLRRDLKLYQDLGERYTAAGSAGRGGAGLSRRSSRCCPAESESHALLAEIREKQNRWAEAIMHWQQVARFATAGADRSLEAGRRTDSREEMGRGPPKRWANSMPAPGRRASATSAARLRKLDRAGPEAVKEIIHRLHRFHRFCMLTQSVKSV